MELKLYQTGAEPGDTITASAGAKQCDGSVLEIISGMYPPSLKGVETLNLEVIRDQLMTIPRFSIMTPAQVKGYLTDKAVDDNNLYLNDIPDLMVKVVKLTGKFVQEKLDPTVLSRVTGQIMLLTELYNLFPKDASSKAKRHTLLFRPGNWVLTKPKCDQVFSGKYLWVETGEITDGQAEVVASAEIKLPGYTELKIVSSYSTSDICSKSVAEALGIDYDVWVRIDQTLTWAEGSFLKSLLQKCIRYYADYVTIDHVMMGETNYRTDVVLSVVFTRLLLMPGAFIPNLQRYVRGVEMATKRLAVSILEDAYTDNDKFIVSLLSASWLAEHTSWLPDTELVVEWLNLAINTLRDDRYFVYETTPVDTSAQFTGWWLPYQLLSVIGSFQTDINLCQHIAINSGNFKTEQRAPSDAMLIQQAIDHHCLPNLGHYFSVDTVKTLGGYDELFKAIWRTSSIINHRKGHTLNAGSAFTAELKSVQTLMWQLHTIPAKALPVIPDRTKEVTYTLSWAWLAGMLGAIEYKVGNVTLLVMLRGDNALKCLTIKRPSRDVAIQADIDLAVKSQVEATFWRELRTGLELKHVPVSFGMLRGCWLRRIDQGYEIKFPGQNWQTLPKTGLVLTQSFPLHFDVKSPIYHQSIAWRGEGIFIDAMTRVMAFLAPLDVVTINRIWQYLQAPTGTIKIHPLNMAGEGINLVPTIEDISANAFFSLVCETFPGGLERDGFNYRVKSGVLMWKFADIFNYVRTKYWLTASKQFAWVVPLAETRTLWPHQTELIAELIKHKSKTSIIWLPPGLGKTAIVLNYICWLITHGKMCKYVMYALPNSAIATVTSEIQRYGLPYHVATRASLPQPGYITLIEHDYLRVLPRFELMHECLLIVDEGHKSLNLTQRTSKALELSLEAKKTIFMTGTLIKDDQAKLLLPWLQQVVPFPLNLGNYYVALGGIMARKLATKVIVEKTEVEVEIPTTSAYYDYVPAHLGGRAMRINFNLALETCYQLILPTMVKLIIERLQVEPGVFVVVKNKEYQEEIRALLVQHGITAVHLITKHDSINLTPGMIDIPRVVITTVREAEGYSLTAFKTMITSVYPSNEATREQLEFRLNRLDQIADKINIITVHAGILSYIVNKYKRVKSLADAFKQFQREAEVK